MNLKKTLRTGYSTNAQQELLIYADEQTINQNLITEFNPQKLGGWVNDSRQIFVEEVNTSRVNRKRVLHTITKNYSLVGSAQKGKEKTKDELKQKLLHYLRHRVQQPSVSINQVQIKECTRTIAYEKQDYVKGERLKGFQRSKKLKAFSITKKVAKNTVSENKQRPETKNKTIENQKSKFQQFGRKNYMISYPLQMDFPQDLQNQKLRSKLSFYLQKGMAKKYSQ